MMPITERLVSFDDSVDYSNVKEDDEDDYLEEKTPVSELSEGAVVSVGHIAGVKALARNLAEELEEVAGPAMISDDDGSDGVKPSAATRKATSQSTGFRPPINGDMPEANKGIGKTLELMMTKSSWMQMFGPTVVRQEVRMNLGGELVVAIDSTSTRQVAQDNVMLLRDMGCEPQRFPSDAALDDWVPADAGRALRKWKKKLRAARVRGGGDCSSPSCGSPSSFHACQPFEVPLPQTPVKQNEYSIGVFGCKGSPYMDDSHMVTPRSVSRQDRVVKENEALRPTPNTYKSPAQQPDRRYDLNEDSSDNGRDLLDVDHLEGDLTEEWALQIRELSAKEEMNSIPRIEIITHLPLGNIKSFSGYRNKSEKSMQWRRTFIYEMKGTHTPPNDCDAFIKYYCSKFNQSAKARYYSAKREDKEHVCDYINWLNGYARNAGVQFENGGCEAKDHVEQFLDTYDDRSLEERLCHVRVKDIHDLENMINDILKRRDRKTKRDSYALSNLVTALNETSVGPQTGQSGSYDHEYESNKDSFGDGERRVDEVRYSYRGSEYDYAGEDERGHGAAANDHERRVAAEGRFARSDNRRPKGDRHFNNDRGFARDNSNRRQQYGPCAACEGLTHSVHYCYKRCKLCKQVHDAGKCEAFNELASLLRSKVDKNDLTPMLQSVLAEPAVDADYLFAFTGEVKWPEDREMGFMNTMEIVEGNDGSLGENEADELEVGGYYGMRAVVMGDIDDTRTRVLLDTGANISVISAAYAKRLHLRKVSDHGRSLEVRGSNPGVMETRRRTLVKITLGWERVYEFEMWIMDHSAGVDVVLGTDFMITAGVRLYLFHGTARLPDEVTVPLVKSAGAADDGPYGVQVVGGPTEDSYVPRGEWREFRLPRKRPSRATHELWIRRTRQMVPTVMESRRGKPVWVRLTNVSDGTARCYKHSSVVLWLPKRELPREVGYVRFDSSKYNEWQVLAYAEGRGDTLLQKEKELYECWLAEQPPAVERKEYTTPARILARPTENSVAPRTFMLGHPGSDDRGDGVNDHNSVKIYDDSEASVAAGLDEEIGGEPDTRPTEFSDDGDDEVNPAEDSVDMLELTYISVMQEIETEIASGYRNDDDDLYEHLPNEIELVDYAHELAFLPELTETSSTVLDYS
ncbi:hypothetical protein PHMEG_00012981 [Phytophthora megakarya]|uniref:Peptidase A2 domain-containing protein n=1 Tax=Phytophthora megakarya TaxID=4795 RepID=A0A225W8E5_9STRA|nr:hypothetical protein PHMEG_00012981 [Phytophthora megakarya]